MDVEYFDGEYLSALMKNLDEIQCLLKPYKLSLRDYLALTGGVPAEPLALPAGYMDYAEYAEKAKDIEAEVRSARSDKALKARWNHVFYTRPIDAGKFRARMGELLEQRCKVMLEMKLRRPV